MRYLSDFLGHIREMFVHMSCMSVSSLVSLLPYWNYTTIGIYPDLDEISFWNLLETFMGFYTLVPNISNFLYVCQSVSWLTSLLILDKEGGISNSGWGNFLKSFWRYSWYVSTLVQNNSEFLVCLSVCQLAYLFTELRQRGEYFLF